ncbi:DUF2066 domain-containing protein [Vibrio ostreicida]|uniref:DUF2066 domain-containing protein n=1 Tax=Vibrio ostreicida TaxID=526588 RepID=A0ABT8BQG7_9VIBR|nr:DUF2066 domain-containing protein [Vibrio ostreicida]MDN3609392.1 DUF2066 domain-containing protein [Vibrio ostreicida]NPD08281.1 DUF2066 domain-containing protein [Vibrio ostreicida]
MRHFVLLALGLVGFPAAALTNVDLYQTEIVLDQATDKGDAQARVEGMKEIIIRASGSQSSVSSPVVQKALRKNGQYLSQMSYGELEGKKTVRLGFNAPQIRSLLSQAQLPIWPASRSNLLVWLIEETQFERNIQWEHSESGVLRQLKEQAQKRGLPLTLPVGDIDDITRVAVSDLWGGFTRPVGEASQRYPAEAVLIVRVQGEALRWTLYDQAPASIGLTQQAPLSGASRGEAGATQLIDQLSDFYAKKNAVVVASESSQTLKVRFTSLGNAVDFFSLERQLKKLSSVASLDIVKIQGNQVVFNVHLIASQREFEQELSRVPQVIKPLETAQPPVPEVIEGVVENPDEVGSLPQGSEISLSPHILTFGWQGRASSDADIVEESDETDVMLEAFEEF